jgi:hypothetical protein
MTDIYGGNTDSTFVNGLSTNSIDDLELSNDNVKIDLSVADSINIIAPTVLVNGVPISGGGGGIVTNPLSANLSIGIRDIIGLPSGKTLKGITNSVVLLDEKTVNIVSASFPTTTTMTGILRIPTIATDQISDSLETSYIDMTVGGINLTSTNLNFNSNTVLSATGTGTQYFMGDGSLLQYSANSGNSNFYLYKSHSNTPAPPPADGFVYYNNSNQSLVTLIYISHLTDDVIDIEVFYSNISSLNEVYLQDKTLSDNYIRYNITGNPTIVVGSYIAIPVSVMSSGGTGSTSFGVNHPILLSFFTNSIEVDTRLSSLETKTQNMDSVLNQTGINGNLTVYGSNGVIAQKFITVGALSTEFIKGNGSLDGNTYATTTITDGLLSKKLFIKNVTVGITLGVPYVDICPTVIGNLTIPANSVKQGDIYALTIEGAYVMTSNNSRPLIRITIGGVLFTNVDIFPSQSGSFGFKFILKFSVWTIGTVSTGSAITTLETGSLSNAVINSQMAFIPGGLPTFNTTISNTVLIEAHSTSATITVNLVPYFIFLSKI